LLRATPAFREKGGSYIKHILKALTTLGAEEQKEKEGSLQLSVKVEEDPKSLKKGIFRLPLGSDKDRRSFFFNIPTKDTNEW